MISFLNLFAFIVLGTAVHLDSIGQISKDRFYNRVDSIIKSRMGNRFPSVSVAIVIDVNCLRKGLWIYRSGKENTGYYKYMLPDRIVNQNIYWQPFGKNDRSE